MDNPNPHTQSLLYEPFEPKQAKQIWNRVEFVFTPKHGTWLNMAEIELTVLNGQCLNRRIDNINTLKQAVEVCQNPRNNKNSVINSRFETKDPSIKFNRLYPSIEGRLDATNAQPYHTQTKFTV